MNHQGRIAADIAKLIELFAPVCAEHATLDELKLLLHHQAKWPLAHALFGRIRTKSLSAERSGNKALSAQYFFEEVCAKTLYNLSGEPAPFDADSPYWIMPNAMAFARCTGISDAAVLQCLSAQGN